MGNSLVQLARSFIWNCTGYMAPEWRVTAEHLRDEIAGAVEAARAAADAAAELLAARALDPAGGMTALRGAIAAAGLQVAAAEKAAALAAKRQKVLLKHLSDNKAAPDTVGDTAALVRDADDAVEEARATQAELRKASAPSTAWHDLAARLHGGLAVRVAALTALPGGNAALADAHARLIEQLKSAGAGGWDESRVRSTVGQVTTGIEQLEQDLAQAESGPGGGPEQLAALRKAAMRRFYDAIAGYDMAGVLAAAAEKLRAQDPRIRPQHLAGAMGSQATAPDRLERALASAGDSAAIDGALQAALKSFRDSVATFATQVQDGTLLPALKSRADTAVAREVDVATYNQKKDEVAEALRELRVAGAEAYAENKKLFDDAVAKANDTQDYKTAGETTLPALLKKINSAYTSHKQSTETELRELRQQVEALRKKLMEAAKGPNAKAAAPVLTTIRANLAEADNFLDCNGNIEAAFPALGIIAEVTELLRDFSTTSSQFAELNKTLGEIKTGLTNADLKLLPAADLAALNDALANLQSPNHGLSPAAFKKAVDQLKVDVLAQTDFVAQLKQWRIESGLARDALQLTFTAFSQAVTRAPESVFSGKRPDPGKGEIKAGLDMLAGLLTAEIGADGFDAHKILWTQTATKVSDGLALVWDSGGKVLKDSAAIGKDAELGTKRAETIEAVTGEWQTLRDKAQGYSEDIAAAKGNIGEYQVLMKQLDGMAVEIEKDPDVARAQLADIEKRLATIRGTPGFDQVIARAIGQVPGQWRAVLDLTSANLDKLRDAVGAAAAGGDFDGGIGAFGTLISDVKSRFEPAAFTAIAESLAEADPTGAKRDARRKTREEGLRLVRQYQANFDDPLFQHLQANPFGVPVFGPLFRFLDRVELELTRIAC
jgi:hypothetical protein